MAKRNDDKKLLFYFFKKEYNGASCLATIAFINCFYHYFMWKKRIVCMGRMLFPLVFLALFVFPNSDNWISKLQLKGILHQGKTLHVFVRESLYMRFVTKKTIELTSLEIKFRVVVMCCKLLYICIYIHTYIWTCMNFFKTFYFSEK